MTEALPEKLFSELKAGDKFSLPSSSAVGVCVVAPKALPQQSRFYFWREKLKLRAVCIELHPYLGPVEWNITALPASKVFLHPKP